VPWYWEDGVWANALPLAMLMLSRINVALVFRRFGRVFSFVFLTIDRRFLS
jgi:hypothetical protein